MAFIYNGYNKYFRDLVFIYCGVFAQPCVQRMPTTYGVDLVNMEILKHICYARHPSCEWCNGAMTSDSAAKNLIKRLHIYNTVIRGAYLIHCQTSLWILVTLLVALRDDKYCFTLFIKTLIWRFPFLLQSECLRLAVRYFLAKRHSDITLI